MEELEGLFNVHILTFVSWEARQGMPKKKTKLLHYPGKTYIIKEIISVIISFFS